MAIIQNLKNSVYLHGNQNSEHFSGKLVSFCGLRPRPPPGLRPWTPLGDFRPQTPSDLLPLGQIPSYATEWLYSLVSQTSIVCNTFSN